MNPGGSFFKTAIILASLYGILFWLWFLWQRPGFDDDNASAFFLLPVAMMALSLMMAIAAAKATPKWVLGLSLVAFFPVGLYFPVAICGGPAVSVALTLLSWRYRLAGSTAVSGTRAIR